MARIWIGPGNSSRKRSSWNLKTPPTLTAWAGCFSGSTSRPRRWSMSSRRWNSRRNRMRPSRITWATSTLRLTKWTKHAKPGVNRSPWRITRKFERSLSRRQRNELEPHLNTVSHRFNKHYTPAEARALLPEVRQWLKQLLKIRETLERSDERLSSLMAPGCDLGGRLVNDWV